MPFELKEVVPWGRSYTEYCRMFALSGADLRKSILGCGDGPASFNREQALHGVRVVSVDPLYRFDGGQIEQRIQETSAEVLDQTRKNRHEFVWVDIKSVEELGRIRKQAMRDFIEDYAEGRRIGRYIAAGLPDLPFQGERFQLALCSHFLFLYSDHYSLDFHVDSIQELCRVADEVRIFPLVKLGSVPSQHVEPAVRRLEDQGLQVDIEQVGYEFQRGGNRVMRVRKKPV